MLFIFQSLENTGGDEKGKEEKCYFSPTLKQEGSLLVPGITFSFKIKWKLVSCSANLQLAFRGTGIHQKFATKKPNSSEEK